MTTKVKIEFEISAAYTHIVDMWIDKATFQIRLSRFLTPGSWKIDIQPGTEKE